MKPYFGYIRVSTPKQGRGVSLDEQRSAISAFALRCGFQIVAWYVETETAARLGRTEYTKMLKALERGQAKGVVIHKIDRGARNLKDWANLGELIDRGLDVQFAHESLDMRSRGGRLAADIQAVVAADYIRNLRDEVLKGFYGRLKQGVYPLPAPVGYLNSGAGVPKAADPVAGPLVRFAFERYSRGDIGLVALQQELAKKGLKTRRGAPLSISGLADVLHNPFYVGIIRIARRGETFQGAHTPLISKELFDCVQMVLLGRHQPKAQTHLFRYRGMVAHVGCSRRLTGEIAKGRYVYYRCHGPECKGITTTESKLDRCVEDIVVAIACSAADLNDLKDLVEAERANLVKDLAREREVMRLRLANLEDRLVRLTDALLDAAIDKKTHDRRHAILLGEIRHLKDRIEASGGEPFWFKLYREFELRNIQLLRYETLNDEEKRELISALCSDFGLDGKRPVIALRSPYKEIADVQGFRRGGAHTGDVRTEAHLDGMSTVPLRVNSTPTRAMEILAVFHMIASPRVHGKAHEQAANDIPDDQATITA
jgi:site-specific DNA recombinase